MRWIVEERLGIRDGLGIRDISMEQPVDDNISIHTSGSSTRT